MGDIVVVPGVTEDDLRAAAIDQALRDVEIAPVLAAHEFTKADYIEQVRQATGRTISESTAARYLNAKIFSGTVESGTRYDQRAKRAVVAYWNVEKGG